MFLLFVLLATVGTALAFKAKIQNPYCSALINDAQRQESGFCTYTQLTKKVVSNWTHWKNNHRDTSNKLLLLYSPRPPKEIKGFARVLLSDLEAVKNGTSLPWGNGPVESLVNKL